MRKNNRITRRRLLKDSMLMGMAGTLTPWTKLAGSTGQPLHESKKGLIAEENSKEGTTDWQLTYVRSRNYRSEVIEGYCSKTSVSAGETIDIFVSANQSTEVSIHIYRMGYYGGKGARHITSLGPFSVEPQPTSPVGEHRLRECKWKSTILT